MCTSEILRYINNTTLNHVPGVRNICTIQHESYACSPKYTVLNLSLAAADGGKPKFHQLPLNPKLSHINMNESHVRICFSCILLEQISKSDGLICSQILPLLQESSCFNPTFRRQSSVSARLSHRAVAHGHVNVHHDIFDTMQRCCATSGRIARPFAI